MSQARTRRQKADGRDGLCGIGQRWLPHNLQSMTLDKAKVENAVQVAQRWIVAALRHRKFFSLEELNVAIRELLEKLNHRPFRKKDGTRATVWEAIELTSGDLQRVLD